jgi:dipeptidase
MNEHGVGIGESTCSAKIAANGCKYLGQREKEQNCALMSINELSRIGLERCKTARCAVKVMGDLAMQFGFYGENSGFETGAESLKVIDNNEAFEFEILASDNKGRSAIWVA